jgi:hypothetical protein
MTSWLGVGSLSGSGVAWGVGAGSDGVSAAGADSLLGADSPPGIASLGTPGITSLAPAESLPGEDSPPGTDSPPPSTTAGSALPPSGVCLTSPSSIFHPHHRLRGFGTTARR